LVAVGRNKFCCDGFRFKGLVALLRWFCLLVSGWFVGWAANGAIAVLPSEYGNYSTAQEIIAAARALVHCLPQRIRQTNSLAYIFELICSIRAVEWC
jgi:hypothetical protein